MFSEVEGAYYDMSYSTYMLRVLHVVLYWSAAILARFGRPPDGVCLGGSFARLEKFSLAVWNLRHLVLQHRQSYSLTWATPSFGPSDQAAGCINELLKIHFHLNINKGERGAGGPLFSVHATSCLLYAWTYASTVNPADPQVEANQWLSRVGWIMRGSEHSAERAQAVGNVLISVDPQDYPRRLLERLCSILRSPDTPPMSSLSASYICFDLSATQSEAVSSLDLMLPVESALIGSFVIGCRLKMCGGAFTAAQEFMDRAMNIMYILLLTSGSDSHADQIYQLSFKHNFTAVLARAIIYIARDKPDSDRLDRYQLVLDAQIMAVNLTAPEHDERMHKRLLKQLRAVWHDTLFSLRDIRSSNAAHARFVVQCNAAWLEYGEMLGFHPTVDVVTSHIPSQPHPDSRYWEIRKRCFCVACACHAARPNHRLRVCKGCWRVLYCNATCQARDWKLGHRAICREIMASQDVAPLPPSKKGRITA
ncbi:hypothetical protein EIP91_004664 [Steccherinum ochraceum]|uniref:MYND-type domain-containing protein n=1 Tax=Steccherinum ochraceum TaxID=92696 RepID=A0A4R0R8F7_9APHY|nr:hypothetical protein EIP91_004664 [Steccherinum ochraceum]